MRVLALMMLCVASQAAALDEVTSFGSNPGNLRMFTYVPTGLPAQAPLVVVLHGCSQGAADLAAWNWTQLADRWRFALVFPEQKFINNTGYCFNWFTTTNQTRDQGELGSIMQMITTIRASSSIDPSRIFVAGFSGGGALAIDLLATAPEVFSAGASLAGIPFACASSAFDAVSPCLSPGRSLSASEWAARVRAKAPSGTSVWPRVSIWQGMADTSVNPENRSGLLLQWTELHGIDQSSDATELVTGGTRYEHRDASGKLKVELYELTALAHSIPVAPRAGCGQTGTYFTDTGLCSSERIARFFGLEPIDAGTMPLDAGFDAGTRADAGTIIDAGTAATDAGTAAAPDAGQPTNVKGAPIDCGCSSGAPLLLSALVLLLRRRRE